MLTPTSASALEPGDVLVAPGTDPSWTPLFVPAAAVVVDVGAALSHAVIVSRELGIPCVPSAVDATRRIPDGAIVDVDGDNGTVRSFSFRELAHHVTGLLRLRQASAWRRGGRGILYEDELVYVGHVFGKTPAYRGWLVVEPKRHAPGLGDLTDDEACAVGRLTTGLRPAEGSRECRARLRVRLRRRRAASPRASRARYQNTPLEFWGAELTQWPDAPRVDEQEMRALISELRAQLGRSARS